MDIGKLAADITVFLAPFLPLLLAASETTAKEIGEKFGEAAWTKAKSVWNKLEDIVGSDPKIDTATQGLAQNPADEDYQIILAKALSKQLEASPDLANELVDLMKNDQAIQRVLVEYGSIVDNISQHLSGKTGTQEAIIRASKTGNITQEQ